MDPSTIPKEFNPIYIDNDALVQIAKSTAFITKKLEERITERIFKVKPLNVTYESQKSDLILFKPTSKAPQPTNTVTISETTVQPKNKFRYVELGV